MSRVIPLAGSAAAAEALVGGTAASPAAAAIVPQDDRRLTVRETAVAGTRAYVAEPRTRRVRPTILVIHGNRGPRPHPRR